MAESTPQKEARQRLPHALTRHLLAATAGVAGIAALVFMAWGPPIDWALRLALAAALVAVAGAAFAIWRDAGASTQGRALPWLLGAAVGLCGAAVDLAGAAWLSPVLAISGVLLCLFTAACGLRNGVRAAAAGAGLLGALALATAFGLLVPVGVPQATALGAAGPLVLHVLVLAVALAGGEILGRTVERALRSADERERRFLGLLAVAADAYWELDAEGRLVRFSAKDDLRSFVGLRRQGAESGMGRRFWETRGVSFDEPVLETFRQELAARLPMRDVPVRWSDFSGRVRHFTLSAEPRTGDLGRFAGYWGVLRDITQDVKARQALRATETRYQDLFRRIPTPLVLHRGTRVLDANPAGVALFGFPDLRSLLGQDLVALFDEAGESRPLAMAHLRRLDALPVGESLPEVEFSLHPGPDRMLTVRMNSVRVDVAGEAATLSIIVDDTERRASEDLVRRSEALLSHLVATSPDWITLTELPAARYAMVNPTFLATTGYRAEEVIGHTADELALWGDPQQRERILRMLGAGQAVQNVPAVMLTRAGQRVSMLVSASLFTIDGIDYQMTSARDVNAIEQARREREAILENALVGIAFTRDRLIVMTNARFDEMFGWPRGLLQNQPQRMVWPSDAAHAEMVQQIGPALARGEQVDIEVPMMRRDGAIFTGRLLAKALDPANPAGGTIWLAEDVTERRNVEKALARARDEAEAANRAKSAFLANTSHEIRTPLNALVGLAQLARTPEVDDRRRLQYIEQICDSADTLSAILSDILDLSKIEAGKLIVEHVAFDLMAIVNSLKQAYGALAHTKGLHLHVNVEPEVPTHVLGDPVRLRQILSNYLTNALKFTSRGSIGLNLQRGVGHRLRFEIVDTGEGMNAEGLALLFLPFSQIDNSITRKVGGTGLGLSICAELAKLMAGEVGVTSEPGKGSIFWAELPLEPVMTEDFEIHISTHGNDALQGIRVLMVEDNPVNMMIAVALLERWGAIVDQADDGPSALHAVDHAWQSGNPFDVVLMDVQMPGMSGHEVTRRLRRRYDRDELPIVALTAAALVSEREDALDAGMNDFLTKPIDAERLRRTLLHVLAEKEQGDGA